MKGDFTGFTFVYNDHSYTTEDLGITRVSDGDRYNEPLIPELEDKTIEIPGLDGSYFYGSDFKSRNFSIKIAFDSLNETQFRLMRQVFGVKHTGLLIFDEAPYKQYRVKIASPPELDFVCFDERERTPGESRDGIRTKHTEREVEKADEETGETTTETVIDITREQVTPWEYVTDERGNYVYERIYKGEGTIEFVAYYPFAINVFKTLSEYRDTDYSNKSEWAEASRLKDRPEDIKIDITAEDTSFDLYNAGDVPMGFLFYVPFQSYEVTDEVDEHGIPIINYTDITLSNDIELSYASYDLRISKTIKNKGDDLGFIVNTVNGLVEGISKMSIKDNQSIDYDTLITSGNIYNEYVTGHFFKVEPSYNKNVATNVITINGAINGMKLYYNYLYF